jgi:methylenetetrahydrofolate reductase (NADPH)
MLCGIGASARMIMTRTADIANLLKTQAPDELIVRIARHRLENPSSRIVKPHFFAFSGVVKTAKWANAVIAGKFVLNSQATGFKVEDN